MADRVVIVLANGQRMIDLPFSYVPGTGSLFVSMAGKLLGSTEFLELGPESIFITDPAVGGETLEVKHFEPVSF